MQKSLISNKNKLNNDILEAILVKEPHDNKYEIIEPFNTLKYPYCFVGIVKCKLHHFGKIYSGEGVGTLIGPKTVLTSAHNLIFNIDEKLINASEVDFIPCQNGSLKIFENVKSSHQVIPDKFKNAKKKGNFDEMIENDYCLLLLDRNFGDELVKYLDTEKNILNLDLKVNDNFYSFFENNQNITNNYKRKPERNNLELTKISMISYTHYTKNYLKVPSFIYKRSFLKLNSKYELDFRNPLNNISLNNISLEYESEISKKIESLKELNQHDDNLNYYMFDKNFGKHFYQEGDNVICEAMGRLGMTCLNDDSDELKYFITTYKGQSGSPIFIRRKNKKSSFIKNLTHPKFSSDSQDEYDYFLIGIHSRSSEEVIKKDYDDCSFYLKGNSIEKSIGDLSTTLSASNLSSNLVNESINLKTKVTSSFDKDFLTKTNYANYNIGLKISKKVVNSIKQSLSKKVEDVSFIMSSMTSFQNYLQFNPKYYPVSLCISGEKIVRGAFNEKVQLDVLFKIAEKVYEIDKNYLCFGFLNEFINYNERNIKNTIGDLVNCFKGNEKEITLEIEVDFQNLGADIGRNLLMKIKDSGIKLEIEKDRNIILIKYIFESIKFLQGKFINIYGMTFDAVKSHLFKEFNFIN